jgi:hypothetical protein
MGQVAGNFITNVTTTTPTVVLSSPASATRRILTSLTVFNDAGSAVDYRIDLRKGSTDYGLKRNAALASKGTDQLLVESKPLVLDDTNESLQITLAGSGDVDIVACYVDEN